MQSRCGGLPSGEGRCPPNLRGRNPKEEPLEGSQGCQEMTVYLDWVTSQPYCREAFAQGARLGTAALQAAGGWQAAGQILRREWERRPGADNFEGLRGKDLEGLVPTPLLTEAREVAEHGVEACVSGVGQERVKALPHPSLKGHVDEAGEQIWKDASRGRVLLTLEVPELDGVISAPLARVPKRLPDRTLSTKGRLVWDARRVNSYCRKEEHPPALQPRHSELARLILWWATRFPGVPVRLAKKDTAEAFKWIPLGATDIRFFAADLPGGEFGVDRDITAVYRVLTFGWRGAPGHYMTFAWVIKTAFEALAPPEPHINDSTPFFTMILMDDSVLVEPDVGLRPAIAAETLETLTKTALGEKAINEEKDWEEGRYESSKIIWGLLYDSDLLTRSLPEPKLLKAAHLLNLPDFSYGCRTVDLSLIQELRGNQQFWLSAMPILSGLLGATNALLGPPDGAGRAVPKGHTPAARERTWVRFWEAVEVQRYLIGVRDEWSTTFTHPMVSAMSLQELLAMPKFRKSVVWASGDATLDRVAAVDWSSGRAFSLPVDVFRKPLLEFVKESLTTSLEAREGAEELASEPSPDEDLIVSVTELLAVVALAAARGPEWRGKLVAYAGDNQTVGAWLEKRHTHTVKSPLSSCSSSPSSRASTALGCTLPTLGPTTTSPPTP